MQYRIVVNCGSLNVAAQAHPRLRAVAVRHDGEVARGGHLVEVRTEHPEKFLWSFFEEGFGHLSFTCQLES